jgi:hypothetical protein
MDKNLNTWDNNLEEDYLEDGVLVLEKLENALMDDDDHVEMTPPSTAMVPMSRTPAKAVGASSSITLPSGSQLHNALAPLPPHGGSRSNRSGVKRKE